MRSVLKAARTGPLLDRLELEARTRARAVVAEAEEEARRMRADAEAEREELRRAAAEAGRAEGLAAAAAALTEIASARARRLEELERELAEVALEIGRRIVGRALALDPSLVLSIVREAIAPVRARREVALRVHPADAELVEAELPGLAATLERAPGLVVRADPGLARGDVVVETEAGRVDARVEAQLALLERAIRHAEGRP